MPGADPALRVVVADDHPLFLDGVRALVAAAPGLQVVGTASTGDELVEAVSQADPDIVVTDLRMPGLPVVEAIRRLRAEHAQRNILVLTMHDEDALVEGALQAGARGYALKESAPAAMLAAITAVSQGMLVLGPGVQRPPSAGPDAAAQAFPELTPRERDVVQLVAAGQTNLAVARSLGVTDKTVRNTLSTILAKLRLPDRATLVDRAHANGIGTPGAKPRTGQAGSPKP